MSRVLVTGGTGFLGSHLARQLVDRGNFVRVLVRKSSDLGRIDDLDVEIALGDVTERDSVQRVLDGVDLVFHCAAVIEFGPRNVAKMEAINVGGAEVVLGESADRDIRSVYVSSLSVPGATPPTAEPKNESWWNPDEPVVAYEDQKRRAHLFARSLIESGAAIRIAMPGGIYGWGDKSTMFDLIKAYVQYPIPVGYLPDVRQSTVNVDDCADGLIRIAENGRDGEEYVVVGEAVTMRDWMDLICVGAGRRKPLLYLPTGFVRAIGAPAAKVAGWLGGSPTMISETVAVATHDCAYTGDKLRRELGWAPRPLDEGMASMAAQIQADLSADRARRRGERRRRRPR